MTVGEHPDAIPLRPCQAGPVNVALDAAEIIATPRMVVQAKGSVPRWRSLGNLRTRHRHPVRPPDMVLRVVRPLRLSVPLQPVAAQRNFQAQADLSRQHLRPAVREAVLDL